MTCIVAGSDWLAADRRISNEDGSKSSLVKIASNAWLIAAACGNASASLAVKHFVRKGAQFPVDLIEALDKDSSALVLTRGGHLYQVNHEEAWSAKPLQAMGTGGELALGWLCHAQVDGTYDWQAGANGSACGANKREVIRRAFRFVESRRADCGGGCDIRRI